MHSCTPITDNIFWIGSNDRRITRFENYIPVPQGVTYNSYLIKDEKTCLIDTVDFSSTSSLVSKIEALLDGRNLDYIVVNHMEPDHSGALKELIKFFPNTKIVGNKITIFMIKAFIHDFNEDSFVLIKEGDVLDLGHHKLTFVPVPMLHWPESMVTYDMTDKILFSNDAFGGFGALDGGIFDDEVNFDFYEDEMRRYYSNIVGHCGRQVNEAIGKLGGLEIKMILPSHGVLWRTDLGKVLGLYSKWANFQPQEEGVVIVYGTLYGNTANMAEALGNALSKEGIKDVKIYDASNVDPSFIISEIFKYKGLLLGSASHNGGIYPKMEPILSKLKHQGLKNKYLGIFGNRLWNGGGVKTIKAFAEQLPGIEVIGEAVEVAGAPKEEDYQKLDAIAKAMADKLKSERA